MQILVNGEARQVTAGLRLSELVDVLGLGRRRIAIEVNEDLVPRDEHARRALQAGDRVEIITAVGGG